MRELKTTTITVGRLRDLVNNSQLADDDKLYPNGEDRFEIRNKDGMYVGYVDFGDDAGVWI